MREPWGVGLMATVLMGIRLLSLFGVGGPNVGCCGDPPTDARTIGTYQERSTGVPVDSGGGRKKQVAAGGDVGSSARVREGGCGAAGMMVGRMGRNALLGRFLCGFEVVAGHRGCVGCGRGGVIVDL